ncbi:hypothetical protein Tco_1534054 [Tanacetum coccineum]
MFTSMTKLPVSKVLMMSVAEKNTSSKTYERKKALGQGLNSRKMDNSRSGNDTDVMMKISDPYTVDRAKWLRYLYVMSTEENISVMAAEKADISENHCQVVSQDDDKKNAFDTQITLELNVN